MAIVYTFTTQPSTLVPHSPIRQPYLYEVNIEETIGLDEDAAFVLVGVRVNGIIKGVLQISPQSRTIGPPFDSVFRIDIQGILTKLLRGTFHP